jgi:hypothetical protein
LLDDLNNARASRSASSYRPASSAAVAPASASVPLGRDGVRLAIATTRNTARRLEFMIRDSYFVILDSCFVLLDVVPGSRLISGA